MLLRQALKPILSAPDPSRSWKTHRPNLMYLSGTGTLERTRDLNAPFDWLPKFPPALHHFGPFWLLIDDYRALNV